MKLSTTGIILAAAIGILAAPFPCAAQPSAKVAKIGVLRLASGLPSVYKAFQERLHDLGYVEGENVIFELRQAEGQDALLPGLAADLVRREVDVIFAAGDAAVRAAKQATRTIPIVMMVGGDPVGSGLIASLGRPGGNITGVTGLSPRLSAKRLELLKELMPTISRVAVLFNPDDPSKAVDWQQLQVTARAVGVMLHPVEVRDPGDFELAFAAMRQQHDSALITLGSAFTLFHRAQIVSLAAANRLPAVYEAKEWAEAGGLMAYGPSLQDVVQRAAAYVAKILNGATPSDLPVEEVTTFALVINLNTAQALGLTVPSSLLSRADEVIR
jgi:putative ABC transport system substrate-binding protein